MARALRQLAHTDALDHDDVESDLRYLELRNRGSEFDRRDGVLERLFEVRLLVSGHQSRAEELIRRDDREDQADNQPARCETVADRAPRPRRISIEGPPAGGPSIWVHARSCGSAADAIRSSRWQAPYRRATTASRSRFRSSGSAHRARSSPAKPMWPPSQTDSPTPNRYRSEQPLVVPIRSR